MKTKPKKIWRPRAAGLDPKKAAPFWSGRRAEHILNERVEEIAAEKERRKKLAAKKRAKRKKNASGHR